MKMHRWLLLPVCALMLGAADYAREWPLALGSPDAGAYRITLDEAVYRAATDAALRDVDVVDAPYWSDAQRQFLAEQLKADASWSIVVDQLSESLHEDAVRRRAEGLS